jgi:hypothetical protein
MKKLVMVLAVFSLLLIASCIGPGQATGPQTTKVQVATNPRAPGVIVDMCDAAYSTMCTQTTTSGGIATFSNVPLGSRKITATSERGTVTKYAIIKYVQPPRSFVFVMGVADILPDLDGDGVANVIDNCPMTSNADQADADRDKRGDVCDNCAYVSNYNQADSDGNGIGNVCQLCFYEVIESGHVPQVSWTAEFSPRFVDKLVIVGPHIAHHHNWCSNSISATISLNGAVVESQSTSGCPDVLASELDFGANYVANYVLADSVVTSGYIGSQSSGTQNLKLHTYPCIAASSLKSEKTCTTLAGSPAEAFSAPPGVILTLYGNEACYCTDPDQNLQCEG